MNFNCECYLGTNNCFSQLTRCLRETFYLLLHSKNTWVTIHVNSQFLKKYHQNCLADIIFCRIIKRIYRWTHGQTHRTDELIWGGLGNLRFLTVHNIIVYSGQPPNIATSYILYLRKLIHSLHVDWRNMCEFPWFLQ